MELRLGELKEQLDSCVKTIQPLRVQDQSISQMQLELQELEQRLVHSKLRLAHIKYDLDVSGSLCLTHHLFSNFTYWLCACVGGDARETLDTVEFQSGLACKEDERTCFAQSLN